MKKYVFMRILRSLVSIFLVTTLIYTIIYTLVPRKSIFVQDTNYTKMTKTADTKADYENSVYEKMGYVEYYNSKELHAKAEKFDSNLTTKNSNSDKKIYEAYIKKIGHGWKLFRFDSGAFYAVREIPVYERVIDFYANLIQIDHPWKIKDASNPDLKRYVRIENDPAAGWSVVGSGTKHKYLLYFNGSFPFIHQNFITLNLGTSYPTYQGEEVLDVVSKTQGKTNLREITMPNGKTKRTAVDIYSRTYQSPEEVDARTKADFGDDPYTKTRIVKHDPSMISSSARIGLVGVILSYIIGLAWGMAMARYKDSKFDDASKAILNFMLSLPSVAFVYIVTMVGGWVALPNTFPTYGASDVRSYVLPAFILAMLSVPGLAIWMRRYMIDQHTSDYVRFARSKGLSEKEIARHHIFKNAMVPIVVGIPGAIVGVIVGATLTESIFAFPGMGKMLIDSIKASNNAMVVGLNFIFTSMSVFSLLAGDLLMIVLDPRIKLEKKGSGK